ncbi:hypothetical protein N180_03855 [Pedobacter antarcticus 4BY]|uniref:NAD(P)-binding domain-containing protein n=2 Tax=Pedobacter antarcticus TaxID=34086 RepID=A0A081PFN1_9SPHI|nr:NAD(P)H-binding protein [Pedobacter antarcticus]KEQ29504.1 hypothetical protein N180_03855 [Pedobacter antarcticus 4BY]SFF10993.1 NAD dependent epimerase/dehydratase family protein [Pedobacter antarcticus]
MKKTAIIMGATGSVGTALVRLLLDDPRYSTVLVLLRREMPLSHPKLKQLLISFDKIKDYADQIKGDTVFCCIGTTAAQTPDKNEYRKIDFKYPLDLAWIAQENGATSYHLVSAMGADVTSKVFYSKTKGQLEEELKKIPYESIHIYRPSLLDAKRQQYRFAEDLLNRIMRVVNPLLVGGLKKYRSIKAECVATAMLRYSLEQKKGIFTHKSDQIQKTCDS